jgi:hypothetical protein
MHPHNDRHSSVVPASDQTVRTRNQPISIHGRKVPSEPALPESRFHMMAAGSLKPGSRSSHPGSQGTCRSMTNRVRPSRRLRISHLQNALICSLLCRGRIPQASAPNGGSARGYQELLASLATCRSPAYDRADSRTGCMFMHRRPLDERPQCRDPGVFRTCCRWFSAAP